MAATLSIDRSNLPGSLPDLVIGQDVDAGFTLDPSLSIGSILWRKSFAASGRNVPGRTMTDYTRDATFVVGSVTCHGDDEEDLQDRLEELIEALTQITDSGFDHFTMTYTHGLAVYKWKCTEPADVVPGGSVEQLDDAAMAAFTQSMKFTIARNPIPILGPI